MTPELMIKLTVAIREALKLSSASTHVEQIFFTDRSMTRLKAFLHSHNYCGLGEVEISATIPTFDEWSKAAHDAFVDLLEKSPEAEACKCCGHEVANQIHLVDWDEVKATFLEIYRNETIKRVEEVA